MEKSPPPRGLARVRARDARDEDRAHSTRDARFFHVVIVRARLAWLFLCGLVKSRPRRRRAAALRSANRGLASLNMKERERTFIMVKPDAVQRGLVGNIIT